MMMNNDERPMIIYQPVPNIREEFQYKNIVLNKFILILSYVIIMSSIVCSQEPYGDPIWKKRGIMDGNLVRTIFFNHGEVTHWPDQPSCEWPKGSGQSYLDAVAPWVAAEVVDIDGNTIHPLEANYRENVDLNPETGVVWGWQPLPGYVNLDQDSPAMSNDPGSWPERWPDQPDWYNRETGDAFWNGYFGMGVKNADLETYFVMDDAVDKEFAFYPDSTDSTRGGLGLRVGVRGFQWSQVLAEDVIFWHYDIKNVGTTDYEKALFGMYIDFGIGGTDDSSDDQGEYDPILDITFAWDGDGVGDGGWGPVGVAGYAFLESPGIGDTYIYDEFGVEVEMLPGDGIDNDDDGLIDESRNNPRGDYIFGSVGIYNNGEPKWHWDGDENGDWDSFSDINGNEIWDEGEPLNDDLGADGVGPTDEQYPGPDFGEGDGMPTDGEPDYNQTDKDESDQIGLTSVKLFKLHDYELKDDERVWNIMAFGEFDPQAGDVNLGALYASGPFTLQAGQTERFSMALLFGEDRDDLLRNKIIVQGIYNASYNFSKPPEKPTVTAVPGDQRVTLYWDRRAESSYDRFLRLYDFEGYKIYRATDSALLEPKIITDAYGNRTYRKAIFQCDLINFDPDTLWWVKGTHPADINGVQFDMGDDTGLVHVWTDSTVQNGQTYYYAVVSYDRGFPPLELGIEGLPPTECTSIIKIDDLGYVTATDINTVVVTPNAPVAGYQAAQLEDVYPIGELIGTGTVTAEIINPSLIKDNTYQIAFTHSGVFVTESYSVMDVSVSPPDTILNSSVFGRDEYGFLVEGTIFDGLRVFVDNYNDVQLIDSLTGWTAGSKTNYNPKVELGVNVDPYPADYDITFFSEVIGTDSSSTPKPVNFTVMNVSENRPTNFRFQDGNGDGFWSKDERIRLREIFDGSEKKTWLMTLSDTIGTGGQAPGDGDMYQIRTTKPFRSGDIFQFKTEAASIDRELAASDLDLIAVVPNPYVVSATWEPKSLFSTGRGARMVEFIHLPKECTIRIYTVRGYLVDTIHHNKDINDGSEFWDLRTKDGMDIAYGLYIFHIDAPGVGETIGKFAVVK
jgi:hypothetical protein